MFLPWRWRVPFASISVKGVFLALSSFLSWPCRVLRLCPRKNEIASPRKIKAQVKPPKVSMSHHVPRVGLNTMFRGGGGRGGAKTTAYRKEENDETALLEALAGLLRNFSNAKQHSGQKQESQQFAQPTPKTKSNAKGKGTSAAPAADQAHDTPETGLLRSLERIIERTKREPGTLLKRLTSLVSTATQNNNKKQKKQQWNKAKQMPGPTEATHEPPKKKMKASPGMSPENSSTENTTRQTSQKRPAEQTWADVVKNKPNSPENGKGKGQNKPADKSNKSPNARSRTNPTQIQSQLHYWKVRGKKALLFLLQMQKDNWKPDSRRVAAPLCARIWDRFNICKDLQNCTISQRNLLDLFGPPVRRRWLTQH